MPNFAAAYAVQNIWPAMPAVEEMVTQQAGALLAHHRQDGASDIHRAEQQRLDLIADLFGAQLLEEAGEEVARVVDQDVDSAELRDGGLDGRLRILRAGDVELDGQQVVVVAHRSRDLRRIAAGGDNGVAGGQGGLGDVDAQASTSAGDEPHFLFSHHMFLIRVARCENSRNSNRWNIYSRR